MKYILNTTNEAQELLKSFIYENEKKIYEGLDSESLESHLAKYNSTVPSLALCMHFMEGRSSSEDVSKDCVEKAISLVNFLEHHAKYIYMNESSQGSSTTRKILQAILDRKVYDGMRLREFYRSKIPGIHDEQTALEALEVFILDKAIMIDTYQPQMGRPSKIIKINNLLLQE